MGSVLWSFLPLGIFIGNYIVASLTGEYNESVEGAWWYYLMYAW
jgi:hypothetical protein